MFHRSSLVCFISKLWNVENIIAFNPEHPKWHQDPKFTAPKRDDEHPRPFHMRVPLLPLPRSELMGPGIKCDPWCKITVQCYIIIKSQSLKVWQHFLYYWLSFYRSAKFHYRTKTNWKLKRINIMPNISVRQDYTLWGGQSCLTGILSINKYHPTSGLMLILHFDWGI